MNRYAASREGFGVCINQFGFGAEERAPRGIGSHWTHMTWTWDATSHMRFFRDGKFLRSRSLRSHERTITYDVAKMTNLCIGSTVWSSMLFGFFGSLAEIRIWNRCLGDDEIARNFNRQLRGDEKGLVLCLRCPPRHALGDSKRIARVPEGSIAKDASSQGNDAVVGNGIFSHRMDIEVSNVLVDAGGKVRAVECRPCSAPKFSG